MRFNDIQLGLFKQVDSALPGSTCLGMTCLFGGPCFQPGPPKKMEGHGLVKPSRPSRASDRPVYFRKMGLFAVKFGSIC